MSSYKSKAFTLIELLIVVAIIAILAAIAVPNFLEAQVRAKVARVMADERSLATAMEAYQVDWNSYPSNSVPGGIIFIPLSTPIAYMSNGILEDPFGNISAVNSLGKSIYFYIATFHGDPGAELVIPLALPGPANKSIRESIFDFRWWIASAGPDRIYHVQVAADDDPYDATTVTDFIPFVADLGQDPGLLTYDPSNGTISPGDVVRTTKGPFTPATIGY
jgi:prepilin-type N-terminal cleavage/methylation domain-containing protein